MKTIDLDKFNGIKAKIDYEPVVDKYSKECCDKIKSYCDTRKIVKTGKYKAGWTTEAEKDYLGNYSVIVWNKTSWQLTHLLENGHNIVNKKGGFGRTSPYPHIRPSYRAVSKGFERAIKQVQIETDFK